MSDYCNKVLCWHQISALLSNTGECLAAMENSFEINQISTPLIYLLYSPSSSSSARQQFRFFLLRKLLLLNVNIILTFKLQTILLQIKKY